MKILAVLVNYGTEQIGYLNQVVSGLKSFKEHDVSIIINSNVDIEIGGVTVNKIHLNNYQYLPLTSRETIW